MPLQENAEIKAIFAHRLAQARQISGLSLRELAERIQPPVSYNALHKYEAGTMMPGSEVLIGLAEALGQSLDFFFRPVTVNLESIEFRKKSRLGAKKIREIRESAIDFFERYLQLEDTLGIRTDFKNPLGDRVIGSPDDVERAAEDVRVSWHQGMAPLINVIELLEQHQIKVLVEEADEAFDGFAGMSGELPVMVINSGFPKERMRLTALHELGHLLLRFEEHIEERVREKLCHRFAGAMLMPREVFLAEFGNRRDRVTLQELLDVKGDYGISIAAIMARAYDLRVISENTYVQFSIIRRKEGWDKKEPGVEFASESSPNRFEQLLHRAIATGVISLSLAASLAKRPLPDFQKTIRFLP